MMAAKLKTSGPRWVLLAAFGLVGAAASGVHAQTTWQWDGDGDPLWSIGGNWTDGMPDNNLVIFSDEGEGEGPSVANDAPAGIPPWQIEGIYFDPASGTYVLEGELLEIGSEGILSESPEIQGILNEIELTADQVWDAQTNTIVYLGDIELGGNELTFEGNSVHEVGGAIHGEAVQGEVIIDMAGGGLVLLAGEGTYAGDTTHIGGGLLIGADNALGDDDSSLIIDDGGDSFIQAFFGAQEIGQDVELRGDLTVDGSDQLEFSGEVELFDFDRTLDLENTALTLISGNVEMNDNLLSITGDGEIHITGNIDGTAGIEFSTEDVVRLQGNNVYEGTTTLAGSHLQLGSAGALGNSDLLEITDDSTISSFGAGRTVRTDVVDMGDDLTLAGGLRLTFNGDAFNVSSNSTLTLANTGVSEILSDTMNLGGTLTIDGSNNLLIASDISGGGGNDLIVDLTDGGTLTLSGVSDYTGTTFVEEGILRLVGDAEVQESDIIVNDDGRLHLDTEDALAGADVEVNDDGVITGIGQVGNNLVINDGGLLSPGHPVAEASEPIDAVGTLHVGNEFEMADGSEYLMHFHVFEDDHDQVIVGDPNDENAGVAELAAGSRIVVSQIDTGFLRDEATMNIVESGAFTGATQTAINNDDIEVDFVSLFVEFELSIDDPAGEKQAFVLTADRTPFEDAAEGRNNRRIARAMDSLGKLDPLDVDSSLFLGVFDQLEDFGQFNDALQEVSPERYTAVPNITFQKNQAYNRELNSLLRTHAAGYRYTAMPSFAGESGGTQVQQRFDGGRQYRFDDRGAPGRFDGDDAYAGWSFFGAGHGTFDRADTDGERTGYNADTGGFLVGLDRNLDGLFSAGLHLGYSYTDLSFRENRGYGNMHTFRIGPYVDYNWENFYATAAVSYGYHDNEINRRIRFPGFSETARGKFDAHDVSLHIGTGNTFWLRDLQTALTPFGTVDFTHYRRDSFSESGAGGANLDIDSENLNSLEASIGLRLERHIVTDGPRFMPHAYAAFAREFLADDNDVTFQFAGGGDSATIRGPRPKRNSMLFGGGVSALLNENVSAYLSYDGRVESNRTTHSGGFGFSYRF